MVNFALAKTEVEVLQPAEELKIINGKRVYVFQNNVLWKGDLVTTKSLTIGTKANRGKVYIKGVIKNPNKGKVVVIDDDLLVKRTLEIYGNLKVRGRFEKVTTIYTKDLAEESVTTGKLADNAITSKKIKNGEVKKEDIAENAVTAEEISSGAVTSEKISDRTITGSDVSSSAQLKIASIQFSEGSKIEKYLMRKIPLLDFNSIAIEACASKSVDAPGGVDTNDRVIVQPLPLRGGGDTGIEFNNVTWSAYARNNSIYIRVCNLGNSSVDLPPQDWYYSVLD